MIIGESADQDFLIRERLTGDIYDRSEFHRARLDRAGLGKELKHGRDLVRLPPMTLDDVGSPSSLLLEKRAVSSRGRLARRYWPLQWVRAGEVPLGYSADDLTLLGRLGRQILLQAGLGRSDVIAIVLESGPTRDYWQLLLGTDAAGMSSASMGVGASLDAIDAVGPTVLAGGATELVRAADAAAEVEGALDKVHTLIVTGDEVTDADYQRLVQWMGGRKSSIVRAWAPDGVLAMWGQCRGATTFHLWPEFEVIEIIDPVSGLPAPQSIAGDIVWTGTGWYASAIVRLQTNAAAQVIDGECPTCGRRSPRLQRVDFAGGLAVALDASPHVRSWFAELQRTPAGDELVVWLVADSPASSLEVVQSLDADIGPCRVLLVDQGEVDRRIDDAKGERFGDRRALP